MSRPSLFDRRVLFVSGKGGVGKTTVAAACALAAARSGKRVLLAEVEGRDGLPALLGEPGPRFRERPTALGFSILSITPQEALLEYLWLFFRMRAVARSLRRARVLEVATQAVPGFRDLMTAGKVYELAEWRAKSKAGRTRPQYDLVVVDAPPTGQLLPLLEAPSAFRDLIRVGRAHRQLVSIDRLVREQAQVALVAVPEEMSVAETLETVDQLDGSGFLRGPLLVNRVLPTAFPRGTRAAALRLGAGRMKEKLSASGIDGSWEEAAQLLSTARDEDERVRQQASYLRRLQAAGPAILLPFLFSEAFGPKEVEALSAELSS